MGLGGGAKFHDYKKVEILFLFCIVTIVVTNVCILEHSVKRNMHESCKNAQKMFKYLQYEILIRKLLGGTCIAFLHIEY